MFGFFVHLSTYTVDIITKRLFKNILYVMELVLKNRNNLSLTGIKKIKTAEPNQVVAVLENSSIVINGTNLSVQNVSVANGLLELTGAINGIKFVNSTQTKFSVKNMFK